MAVVNGCIKRNIMYTNICTVASNQKINHGSVCNIATLFY